MNSINQLLADPRFALHWQMNRAEQLGLIRFLDIQRPELALEIGTYEGGSLQVIAHFAKSVISVDINPEVESRLAANFPNTRFRIGQSQVILPELIREMNAEGNTPDFVLIDADHTENGVRQDIAAVLNLIPKRETIILVHDSFNPDCRRGILTAPWTECDYVHEVEVDFLPGSFNSEAFDTAAPGSMWSGLACAIMKPIKRNGDLRIMQSQEAIFQAVKGISMHKEVLDLEPDLSTRVKQLYRTVRQRGSKLMKIFRK